MIFITGDTHGDLSIKKLSGKKWPIGRTLTKNDYVIIAGDFGLLWCNDDEENWWLNWFKERSFTLLFVDGNHENFDMVDKLPLVEMFGSNVGMVNDSVFHLRRGEVYEIEGKKIFTMGGGLSIDKSDRIPGKSWWEREQPNAEELDYAWKNIMKHERVDYVITHVPPVNMMPGFNPYRTMNPKYYDPLSHHLRDMSQVLRFEKWYYGHMHVDEQVHEKYVSLYHKIIQLGEDL